MNEAKEPQNTKTHSTHSSNIKDPFQFKEIMNKLSSSQEISVEENVQEFCFEEGELNYSDFNFTDVESFFSDRNIVIEQDHALTSKLSDFESVQQFIDESSTSPTRKSRKKISELLPKELTRVDVRFKKIYRGIIDFLKKKYEREFRRANKNHIPDLIYDELKKYKRYAKIYACFYLLVFLVKL